MSIESFANQHVLELVAYQPGKPIEETARELGMKVANVDYPPNGVANFAIMLMLMSLRKAGQEQRQKQREEQRQSRMGSLFHIIHPPLWKRARSLSSLNTPAVTLRSHFLYLSLVITNMCNY